MVIAPGTIAIREGTILPELLSVNMDPFSVGWASLGGNFGRKKLEAALAAAGWTSFCLAGAASRVKAFGFNKRKMVRAAAKRLLAGAELQGANCVEIDEIARSSFLGLPWITLAGHASHIQAGTSPYMRSVERKRKIR